MSEGPAPDAPEPAEAEATGETVGEARWAAARELERRFPGLDRSRLEYVVLSEGERGLLGVGYVPARVIARVVGDVAPATKRVSHEARSPQAALLGDLLEHVLHCLAVDATATIEETGEELSATVHGRDVGLVIGKHGQTIDAIEYLANAVVSHAAQERVDVTVDAAGYRARRRAALEAVADRAAARVAAGGKAEALEPMSAPERKIVHLRLKDRADVVTESEGAEPNRYVVVRPPG